MMYSTFDAAQTLIITDPSCYIPAQLPNMPSGLRAALCIAAEQPVKVQ